MKSPCVIILLICFPFFVVSQSYSNAIEEAAEKYKGREPLELATGIFNAFVQEVVTDLDLLMADAADTCYQDFLSLSIYKQSLKIVGGKKLDMNRLGVAVDSFGKPQAGIFRGNTKLMGDFDECLAVDTTHLNITMRYCNFPITILIFSKNSPTPLPFAFYEAVCLPTTCSRIDFNGTLPLINDMLERYGVVLTMGEFNGCTVQGKTKYNAGAIIMMLISIIFLLLSLAATGFEVVKHYYPNGRQSKLNGIINDCSESENMNETETLLEPRKKPTRLKTFVSDVIKGFSLYTTIPAVLSTNQPPSAITSINGMRVISMFWIIMCHVYFFTFTFQSFSNPMYVYTTFVSRFASQSILNGFYAVDSFFFLSGLLVAYLTFRQMQRSKGRFPYLPFYIHRILRLTPTYMFLLFFYWFVTIHLGNGPTLNSAIGPGSPAYESCRKYWWTNLLYINNFYPVKMTDECMEWTWYLANDMQFYIISPLLLIPLYHWMPFGLLSSGLSLLVAFVMSGFLSGYYDYSANPFHGLADSSTTPSPNIPDQSSQIYVKPYCRIPPYVVGIVLGYILYKKYSLPVRKNIVGRLVYGLLWGLAIIIGMSTIYGIYSDWHGHHFSKAENVIYYMFGKFSWGVALFLVVYICHNGYGGVVNRFLSLPFWVPLGRLTFNAYLVHEIIMLLLFADRRTPLYYTDMGFIMIIIGATVLAYGAAAVVTVFVEFPLSNLEGAVFKALGAPLRSSRQQDNTRDKSDSKSEKIVIND